VTSFKGRPKFLTGLTIEQTHVAVDVAVLVVVVLDGGVVVGDESLLNQLQGDGRLSNAPVTHDNQLKEFG